MAHVWGRGSTKVSRDICWTFWKKLPQKAVNKLCLKNEQYRFTISPNVTMLQYRGLKSVIKVSRNIWMALIHRHACLHVFVWNLQQNRKLEFSHDWTEPFFPKYRNISEHITWRQKGRGVSGRSTCLASTKGYGIGCKVSYSEG